MTLNDVPYSEDTLEELPLAENSDSYYVNLMINYEDIGHGLYSLENLNYLRKYLNLILVVMEPLTQTQPVNGVASEDGTEQNELTKSASSNDSSLTDSSLTATAESSTSSDSTSTDSTGDDQTEADKKIIPAIRYMELIHTALDENSFVKDSIKIMEKLIPVIAFNKYTDEQLAPAINYSEWNYGGVGVWSIPMTEGQVGLLNHIIFPDSSSAIEKALAPICKFVCPNRWSARLLLFIVIFASVIFAVASIWIYRLRLFYKSKNFIIYMLAIPSFFMLVLWCDPYWQNRHLLILGSLLAFIIAIVIFRAMLQRRSSRFP